MKPRVLLLHTGGTLGMKGTPLEPSGYAATLLSAVPELSKIAEIESQIVANLDSSDVGPAIWGEITRRIAAHREDFDGFVIVHGTDTMAYTASALSFSLRGLGKPVVLTGAQRPLAALRTDARRNLADAVELATKDIPEVGICFDGLLLRGCRTTKASAHDYRGFMSADCAPLARLGVDIQLGGHIRRETLEFSPKDAFDPAVLFLHAQPGLNPDVFRRAASVEGVKAVVLAAFGTGTLPTSVNPLAPEIKALINSGTDVLVITTSTGKVDFGLYKNSLDLIDAGAIPGGNMRLEAALTKMMHALANFDSQDLRRQYLVEDIAGEV